MTSNYYLADKLTTEYKFEIKEKTSMSGSKGHSDERKPLVRIDYFEFEKELIFSYSDTEKVSNADSVKVTVRKGAFGFEILEDFDVF
jgi:hypothetical protein